MSRLIPELSAPNLTSDVAWVKVEAPKEVIPPKIAKEVTSPDRQHQPFDFGVILRIYLSKRKSS
jgi:hypothetical protein